MAWDFDAGAYICDGCGERLDRGDPAVVVKSAIVRQDGPDYHFETQDLRESYHAGCFRGGYSDADTSGKGEK